jgi:SOS response associated peptidase (SRAP)
MCGRYVSPDEASIEHEFTLVRAGWQFSPSYNVAPSQFVPSVCVNKAGERSGALLHQGLIPYWAKGVQPKSSTINATVEEITDAATWRGPWKRGQRCILPALGFYEWQVLADGKNKQTYCSDKSVVRRFMEIPKALRKATWLAEDASASASAGRIGYADSTDSGTDNRCSGGAASLKWCVAGSFQRLVLSTRTSPGLA